MGRLYYTIDGYVANKLELNKEKTEHVVIGSRQRLEAFSSKVLKGSPQRY